MGRPEDGRGEAVSRWLAEARAARAAEQPQLAIAPLLAAVRAAPGDPTLRVQLAEALYEAGHLAPAAAAYRTVLAERPEDPAAASGLALILERTGELDAAEALVAPWVRRERGCPTNAATVWATVCRRKGRAADGVPLLQRALAEPRSEAERIVLSYVLGECLHELGRADQAFEAYREANERRRERYDPSSHTREVDRLVAAYAAEAFRDLPVATRRSEQPLLIVGMMRSGSTLVERILGRHPGVFAAGERPVLDAARSALEARRGEAWPGCAARLDPGELDEVASLYLAELGRDAPGGVLRITDKLLSNYLLLGLVAQLLPGARVIHCVRDPLDTGVSCYFKNFAVSHPYATRLDWLGHRIREHDRLMEHWRRVLPLPIHTVRYERLVERPAQQVRALLEFCGLSWNDACLRPEAAGEVALTASYAQVREPISKRGVGRAAPYRHRLEPLVQALRAGPP